MSRQVGNFRNDSQEMENRNIEDTTKAKAQRFQDLKGWMSESILHLLVIQYQEVRF